jgi:hypothetical protein
LADKADTTVFSNHPAVVLGLAPELLTPAFAGEPRSDCENCVMLCERPDLPPAPWAFNPQTRCCTYHPKLPNFLVGGALLAGGESRRVVTERLQNPDGVSPWGIVAPAGDG